MASQLTPLHNLGVDVIRETKIARFFPLPTQSQVKYSIKRFSGPNFLRRNKTLDKTKAVCLLILIKVWGNTEGRVPITTPTFQIISTLFRCCKVLSVSPRGRLGN